MKPAKHSQTEVDNDKVTILVHTTDVWIWVFPFSNGRVSVGFVGNPEHLESVTGSTTERFKALLALNPSASEMLKGMEFCFEPKEIKAYSRGIKKLFGNKWVLTGNASEFIDPVFSAGVMFATESGVVAAKLVAEELKGNVVNWQKDYEEHMLEGIDVMMTYIRCWYDGSLQKLFFQKDKPEIIKKQITSVLAGYVWDKKNPFVKRSQRSIELLNEMTSQVEMSES